MSTGTKLRYTNPEIWGGLECTINRVKDQYRDQLELTGHYCRNDDIDRIAQLGIRKLRYPILWERHEKQQGQKIDWHWTAKQLNRIRKNKIIPIAGLVHHGSGPAFTDLTDKEFPAKLARYAAKVAMQFPWINYYTPVNEPLTTSRFSGLYGHWYPHQANELCFTQILLNQVKATVLAMNAIREINPKAQLVQTEDLGKTHSTPMLSYQADFENERRWITNDLLCGKVDRNHFFWNYFKHLGIAEKDLEFFEQNPCPPSILGFNYYVTSERYLDEQTDLYPLCAPGGNGLHKYVDTEAVRTGHSQGISVLLKEAWDRYQLPLAVTECHLSCTREEQIRWFYETWSHCCTLKKQGIDIRAVTAWSLLGAFDWNSLLTKNSGHYEPGVFDVSHNRVRRTSLGKLITSLASTGEYQHPLLADKGWWHPKEEIEMENGTAKANHSPLMIIGKTGTLGNAFIRVCKERSIPYIALGRADVDILNIDNVRAVVEKFKPWAVINATGYVRVDDAETDADTCFAINAKAPPIVGKICSDYGIRFMSFSSDLVFDGAKKSPYHETDMALPLNVYGLSKSEGEKLILEANPSALIIRSSAFFGPWDKYNFVYQVLYALQYGDNMDIPGDVIVSPTYIPDLCHTAMDLFIDEEEGIWHLSNDGIVTWAEFGSIIAERIGCKNHKLVSKPLIEMGWRARRPHYSVLQSDKGIKLPALDNAIDRYFSHREV